MFRVVLEMVQNECQGCAIETFRYRYQPACNSAKVDKTLVVIRSARLGGKFTEAGEDDRSVRLELGAGLAAGWIYKITCNVAGACGESPTSRIAWYTVKRLHR